MGEDHIRRIATTLAGGARDLPEGWRPELRWGLQTEVQEKRAWVSKGQFLEGLALVNTLPGLSGIQIGIFLGYSRAGWWGGVLAGLGFILPGFCMLLALTLLYQHYGALPRIRHAFCGHGALAP